MSLVVSWQHLLKFGAPAYVSTFSLVEWLMVDRHVMQYGISLQPELRKTRSAMVKNTAAPLELPGMLVEDVPIDDAKANAQTFNTLIEEFRDLRARAGWDWAVFFGSPFCMM